MVHLTRDGFTYTAARLFADVGSVVQAIGGLQPFLRARKRGKWRTAHAPPRLDPVAPAQ
jgi:hypothetical protein